jgi:hypothetical protein
MKTVPGQVQELAAPSPLRQGRDSINTWTCAGGLKLGSRPAEALDRSNADEKSQTWKHGRRSQYPVHGQ